MDVREAIRMRRSIRAFQDRPVEEEKLRSVLEAGRLAPSASNRQDWKFIVVRDKATREKLARAANNQKFVGEAPVVIVACGTNPTRVMSGGQHACPVDLSIAVDHMTLQAVEEGLGTCWIGAFNAEAVRKILGIPEEVAVVHILPLGYPAQQPPPRPRKPFEEVVSFERWS
ncbi:MAG: nitroreductase family protein [bacterium]